MASAGGSTFILHNLCVALGATTRGSKLATLASQSDPLVREMLHPSSSCLQKRRGPYHNSFSWFVISGSGWLTLSSMSTSFNAGTLRNVSGVRKVSDTCNSDRPLLGIATRMLATLKGQICRHGNFVELSGRLLKLLQRSAEHGCLEYPTRKLAQFTTMGRFKSATFSTLKWINAGIFQARNELQRRADSKGCLSCIELLKGNYILESFSKSFASSNCTGTCFKTIEIV